MAIIAPSILSAEFGRLTAETIASIRRAHDEGAAGRKK